MGGEGVVIHRLGAEVRAVGGAHDTHGEDRDEALPYGRLGLRVRNVVTDAQQERAEPDETGVRLHLSDGSTHETDVLLGADGLNSVVRRTLWETPPSARTISSSTADTPSTRPWSAPRAVRPVLTHSSTVQGAWTAIRSKGRDGFQWWALHAHDIGTPSPTSTTRQQASPRASPTPCPSSSRQPIPSTPRADPSATANPSSSGPRDASPQECHTEAWR